MDLHLTNTTELKLEVKSTDCIIKLVTNIWDSKWRYSWDSKIPLQIFSLVCGIWLEDITSKRSKFDPFSIIFCLIFIFFGVEKNIKHSPMVGGLGTGRKLIHQRAKSFLGCSIRILNVTYRRFKIFKLKFESLELLQILLISNWTLHFYNHINLNPKHFGLRRGLNWYDF